MLAQVSDFKWQFGIGDPTFIGWFITFAYFATAVVSFRLALKLKRHEGNLADARVWFGLGAMMLFLCFNKQLDLQTLLTDFGRSLSKQQGWYESRRKFQLAFIVSIVLFNILLAFYSFRHMKGFVKKYRLAFVGFFLLMTFIFIRASSFHHLDTVVNWSFWEIKLNWILEVSAITSILLSSLLSSRDISKSLKM